MTRSEAIGLFEQLRAAYPRPAWKDDEAALYVQHLERLEHTVAAEAVDTVISKRTSRPTIAHIEAAVVEAWGRSHTGSITGPKIDDPLADELDQLEPLPAPEAIAQAREHLNRAKVAERDRRWAS